MDVSALAGDLIVLRPLVEDDARECHRWLNDPEVQRTLAVHGQRVTEAAARTYIREAAARADLLFAITARDAGLYVGNCGLHAINLLDGRAELGIVIGRRERWGRGYGTETVRLLCRHAFGTLGLHRVSLTCYATNARGLALYQRVGFRVEGRRREAVRVEGRWVDEIVLGLLAGELR